MGLSSEMKNLSEELIASFKQRIKENEELVIEVQKTLDGFQKDHQEMANALRTGLDKGEVDRLKEFDILMKSINEEILGIFASTHELLAKFDKEHQAMSVELRKDLAYGEVDRLKEFDILIKSIKEEILEIFASTRELLAKFDKEHQAMSVELRKDLANGEVDRLKEFNALIKSIKEEILRIFTYTHDLLAKFDKEHQAMSVELRKDLANGEVDRLKEYNVIMKGIRTEVKGIQKAVAELLGDFAQDREGASAAWKKMSDILAQLRNTAVAPPKQVVKKEVKPAPVAAKIEAPVEAKVEVAVEAVMEAPVEAKVEVAVEAVMEAPVAVEPKEEPKPKVPITLEAKVLDYINKHPKGIKISEMEAPLSETRMKLGFIAKALLDEGKVQKVENVYFPIK